MPWYTCCMVATPSTMIPLGTAAPPFALPDVVGGETISLETFADKKALLVMFLCRHCMYVQHVKQALTVLGREYQGADLAIVGLTCLPLFPSPIQALFVVILPASAILMLAK